MNHLQTAQRLYVRKEFTLALTSCLECIRCFSSEKNHHESCLKRSCQCFPVVCLAVQLFGETQRHTEVIPFCITWYTAPIFIPAYVASLCATCLGKGGYYEEAENFMQVWCENKDPSKSWSTTDSVDVREINHLVANFVHGVLIPQHKYAASFQVLDKMSSFLSSTCLAQLREDITRLAANPRRDAELAARNSPLCSPSDDPPSKVQIWRTFILSKVKLAQRLCAAQFVKHPQLAFALLLVVLMVLHRTRGRRLRL